MRRPATRDEAVPRAWPAVLGTFSVLTFASGLTFYAWPVYFDELVAGDFTLAHASTAMTVFFVVNALAGLAVARGIVRFDTRTVLLGGAVVCAAGLTVLPLAGAPWQLFCVFAALGLGSSASTLIPVTTFLLRRLHIRTRRRGLTLGMSGLSVGGVAVAPVVGAAIATYGLDSSAALIGAAYLLLVGIPALMMSSRAPAERDGAAVAEAGHGPGAAGALGSAGEPAVDPAAPPPAGTTEPAGLARPAYATVTFALLAGAAAIMMCNHLGPQVHLVHLAEERGAEHAVLLISIVAGASLCCRALGAVLLAHFPTMWVFALIGVVQCGSLLLFGTAGGMVGLGIGAAMTGFCIGNLSVVMPLVVLEYFGVGHYPRMFGGHQLVVNLGTAAGPFVIAALHDATSGYELPMLALAGTSAFASTAIIAFLRAHGTPARTAAHH